MKPINHRMARILLIPILLSAAVVGAAGEVRKPNIVFIVGDDLGYGDLGCYGQQKIKTPNLDRLAAEGMRFTQHYSGSPVCAPSRCVLMTGMHPGHAIVRDNRGMKPEGQFPLPAGTVTLPRLLQQHGYTTGAFGKWGLGGPGTSGDPLAQGINRFYGYNCQGVAHNFYPTYLWDNDRQVALDNPVFPAHDKFKPDEDPQDPRSYARFQGRQYSADLIAEQARAFVRANQGKPFFLFVPTTVPHLALQVPEDSIQQYAGLWDDPPYTGGKGYLPQFRPRAAYAAMITRMDREIGSLVSLVRELGLERDTLFVFSSDNGPLYDKYGGTDCEFFNSHGGLRGRKGSLYEGGFRVPCIVRWTGRIQPGTVSDRVTGFEDWLPTLLELCGIRDATPAGLDGISFAPTLLGEKQPERPFLYREFPGYGGQQCVRVGQWKAVRQNLFPRAKAKAGKLAPVVRTELYDLAADPTESRDVAAEHPEIVARLEQLFRAQHVPSKDFPLPVLDAEGQGKSAP
jgi:arylsulfatase A-like enzyme